jgi:hypothetical protein
VIHKSYDWLRSESVAQICDYVFSTPNLDLGRLKILMVSNWQNDVVHVETAQWVDLLLVHPLTSIKDLFLDEESIQYFAPALKQLSRERVEALPALQNIFLWGSQPSKRVKKMIGKFVAARQLSCRPVAVYHGI